MKGLEISIINLKEAKEKLFRIDSEFFKKNYLSIESLFENRKTNSLLEIVERVQHPAEIVRIYQEEGIQILLAQNVRSNRLDLSNKVFMDSEVLSSIGVNKINYDDVVLTRSGANYGQCACFKTHENIYACADLLIIRNSGKVRGGYLSTFLNTKYGRSLLDRGAYGMAQPHIAPTYLNEFRVVRFSESFESLVDSIIMDSLKIEVEAAFLYSYAERQLLDAIGINDFTFSNRKFNEKGFRESFLQSGRLDAEYYQPKFDELKKFLVRTGNAITLGSDLHFNKRGTQPQYTELQTGLMVLNSKHIRENRIEFSDNRLGVYDEKNQGLIIQRNDLLMNGTGVGTIGRSAVYLKDESALPDNHVTILRTTDLDPVFLSVQLNSIIGKLQVEKYFKGSSGQIELYPNDINEFVIWKAPQNIQQQVRATIEESERLRYKSMVLLEIAKRAVEIAIENDEHQAIAYVNQKTK